MDGSFETIEKAAGFHNRVHYRKPSEKDHKSFFDAFSQPAGNLATQRLLRSGVIQPKLAISQPGDVHEQDADRIADHIIRMPEPSLERTCAAYGDAGSTPVAQRKAHHQGDLRATSGSDGSIQSLDAGKPLDESMRAFFEPRLGCDFGDVRVHTDARAGESARAVNALAYTVGKDIVFAPGQYSSENLAGKNLLAHELTHVVQQSTSTPSVQRQKDKNKDLDIRDILPPKVGIVEQINREVVLRDIFGDQLDALVSEILANANAVAFTRKTGVRGVIALVDTRGPKGFDPVKADAALQADDKKPPKDRIYGSGRLEPRAAAQKSYWFGANVPEPPKVTEAGIELERIPSDLDLVEDPQTVTLKQGSFTMKIRFASVGRGAADEIKRGRTSIIAAIVKMLKDLDTVPAPASKAAGLEDKRIRARLKEAARGLTAAKPLRILIASSDMEALYTLRFQTAAIFIRKEDIGDESKLEAAIRLPLVAFLGTESPAKVTALTTEEAAEGMLHEMVHALLLRRGIGNNAVWDTIKNKVADGPATVRNRCEELIELYLRAQEEVFVYDSIAKLGSAYSSVGSQANAITYLEWLARAKEFLINKGVVFDRTTKKLDVAEKVGGKKVDWSIDFVFPRKVTVAGPDLTPLNQLIRQYPGH